MRSISSTPLDEHQRLALEFLYANPRAALFLEMSLGKTLTVLEYIRTMPFNKVLIIAPKNVAGIAWPQEVAKWTDLRVSVAKGSEAEMRKALAADADIYTIGSHRTDWLMHEYYKKRRGRYEGGTPFDCIVIDESTMFKTPGSNRFRALKRLIAPVQHRILMTGTPKPQGDVDLWAQMYLLDGGERLGGTFEEYKNQYFYKKGMFEWAARKGAPEKIAALISDISLGMNTLDHIQLPPMTVYDEIIQMSSADMDKYRELEETMVLELEDIGAKTAADLVMKLLQLSSGAIYDQDKNVVHMNDAKLDTLADLFEEFPDENLMIVYQFKHEAARILQRFPFVKMFNEKTYAEWNAGKLRGILLHPASAGHGLNLQYGGRRQVWVTPTYNLEHWQQTLARIYRRGLTKEFFVHLLLAEGTRDASVRKRLNMKATDQQFLFDELKLLRARYEKKIR